MGILLKNVACLVKNLGDGAWHFGKIAMATITTLLLGASVLDTLTVSALRMVRFDKSQDFQLACAERSSLALTGASPACPVSREVRYTGPAPKDSGSGQRLATSPSISPFRKAQKAESRISF